LHVLRAGMDQLPSVEVEFLYAQALKYIVGERVPCDPMKGLMLLREAAEQGHPGALWDLNSCRQVSEDGAEEDVAAGDCFIDWRRAVKIYRVYAARNHPIALTNLARCYRYARGVKKDMEMSARYMQQAADLGYSLAQNGLATCYDNGWGVEADFSKALELYKKAAEGGYYRALYNMGVCYANGEGVPRDSAKAMELFERAASLGYYAALLTLGNCYMEGKGKEQNKQKAAELYRKAAEQGDPEGLFSLAGCYLHGLGVEQDIHKAVGMYTQSGEQGFARAFALLGSIYHFGIGDPSQPQFILKDLSMAFECYKRCALMDNDVGISMLYAIIHIELVEKSDQSHVVSSLFQICRGKINRMIESGILADMQQEENKDKHEEGEALPAHKTPLEKEAERRLPREVRQRLYKKKTICERIGCKKDFYGEGFMRRTYYQKALKEEPTETDPNGNTAEIIGEGEPMFLSFCSKECWQTFPQVLEEAVQNST